MLTDASRAKLIEDEQGAVALLLKGFETYADFREAVERIRVEMSQMALTNDAEAIARNLLLAVGYARFLLATDGLSRPPAESN